MDFGFRPETSRGERQKGEGSTKTAPTCRGRRPRASPPSWPAKSAWISPGTPPPPAPASNTAPSARDDRRPDLRGDLSVGGEGVRSGRGPPQPGVQQPPPAATLPPERPRQPASTRGRRWLRTASRHHPRPPPRHQSPPRVTQQADPRRHLPWRPRGLPATPSGGDEVEGKGRGPGGG